MKCQHQFILIEQRTRKPQTNHTNINDNSTSNPSIIPGRWEDEYGARAGCIKCGEIRTVWGNGDLETEVKGNDNASNS